LPAGERAVLLEQARSASSEALAARSLMAEMAKAPCGRHDQDQHEFAPVPDCKFRRFAAVFFAPAIKDGSAEPRAAGRASMATGWPDRGYPWTGRGAS